MIKVTQLKNGKAIKMKGMFTVSTWIMSKQLQKVLLGLILSATKC